MIINNMVMSADDYHPANPVDAWQVRQLAKTHRIIYPLRAALHDHLRRKSMIDSSCQFQTTGITR